MANVLQLALPSYTAYLGVGLNSLADAGMVLGAAIDNNTTLNTQVTWRLKLNTVTPTTGGYIELYCLPGDAAAGNFAEGSASIQPQSCYLKWIWPLRAAAAAPYHFTDPLPMPQFSKWLIRNKAGAALNAATNTLDYALINLTIV